MDETVYQCPECNFNADNLTELDGHITEFHSNETTRHVDSKHMENVVNDEDDEDQEEEDEGDGGGGGGGGDGVEPERDDLNEDDAEDVTLAEQNQDEEEEYLIENEVNINSTLLNPSNQGYSSNHADDDENELYNDDYFYENQTNYNNNNNNNSNNIAKEQTISRANSNTSTQISNKSHNLRQKQAVDYNGLNGTSSHVNNSVTTTTTANNSSNKNNFTVPSLPPQQNQARQAARRSNQQQQQAVATPVSALNPNVPVINSDNHYERQYTCKRCGFFTNNPRAVLYHRKEFHFEKINVHECSYCQYASQYSGKVERHTLLRHKIDINNSPNKKLMNQRAKADQMNKTIDNLNLTDLANGGKNENTTLNNSITLNNSHTTTNSNTPVISHTNNKLNVLNRSLNNLNSQQQDMSFHSNSLNNNNNNNNNLAKFQCNKCPCKYKRSTDLSKHLKLKHGILAQRLSDYLTTNHSSNPSNEYANEQDDAGNQFADETDLNEELYQQQEHEITDENKNNPEDQSCNSYECPYCAYQSQGNDAEYLLHVKDHLAGKSFRCVLCNSVYKYRGDCVVHLKRKHQKADSHAQSYVERFNMEQVNISEVYLLLKPKQQEETENEEKLFSCSYCDYKANYKGDVFKHQTRRHPGSPKNVTALNPQINNNNMSYDEVNLKSVLNRNVARNLNMSLPVYNNNNNGTSNNVGTNQQENGDDLVEYENENEYYNNNGQQEGNGEDEGSDTGVNEYNEDENMFTNANEDYNEANEDVTILNDHEDYTNYVNNDDVIEETPSNPQFQCKFCSFVAKNHAKLQLHLSTHYNLKPYMCPICNRRANFKWDIQKHLRKIHNDYASDVICLSEHEARQSISSYIEAGGGGGGGNKPTFDAINRRPASSLSSMSNQSFNSNNNNKLNSNNNMSQYNEEEEDVEEEEEEGGFNVEEEGGFNEEEEDVEDMNGEDLVEETEEMTGNLRLIARQRTQNAMKERKFKCSLCNRTSKWQWDIRKHLRTVHRGQPGGDVVILRESCEAKTPEINFNGTSNMSNRFQVGNNLTKPQSFSGNSVQTRQFPQRPLPQSLYQPRTQSSGGTVVATCSDPTGNKKFQCTQCPYRSNWKADLFRHLKKRHFVHQPQLENVVILDNEYAASSLEQYEQVHGIHVRKRNRPDFDMTSQNVTLNTSSDTFAMSDPKKIRLAAPVLDAEDKNEENNLDYLNRSNRLPVSIAELNIKPYKCLKCGFRSDRKSDTLRHIRVKHAQAVNAVKFLRIMSIAEASDSIEAYENMRLYKKIKNFNSSDTSVANIYAEANVYNTELSEVNNFFEEQPQQIQDLNETSKRSPCVNSCCELYRCPFCAFKNVSKMIMQRHLAIHFSNQKVKINPVFKCSICSFKSKWKFLVKKHILMNHLATQNAYVLKVTKQERNFARLKKQEEEVEEEEEEIEPILIDSEETTSDSNREQLLQEEETNEEEEGQTDNESYLNEDKSNLDDLGGDRTTESVVLTDYEGAQFTATFMVSSGAASLVNRKKVYFCQTCPYKTCNYSNFRTHLLQHRRQEGYAKCRYCDYYVSKVRLLKQHEILHPEFELRLTAKQIKQQLK